MKETNTHGLINDELMKEHKKAVKAVKSLENIKGIKIPSSLIILSLLPKYIEVELSSDKKLVAKWIKDNAGVGVTYFRSHVRKKYGIQISGQTKLISREIIITNGKKMGLSNEAISFIMTGIEGVDVVSGEKQDEQK